MTRVVSGDIEPKVAMFIDSSNLVWSSPDSLQLLTKVLLKESSLIHDEVPHLKFDVCIPVLLYIFGLIVAGYDEVVMVYLVG